jgi:hypothetical protein
MSSIALLYPGDRAARDRADPAESRFAELFDALAHAGLATVPAVYHDDFADEVEEQLCHVQLVLVWCNPIQDGRRRDRLDAMLRSVASTGVIVSAHPDAILRLGTKDVLLATRGLPFGSDVHRIDSLDQLKREVPERLQRGARVLKQHRGQSGVGVWRVERSSSTSAAGQLRVRHAQRGSAETLISMDSFAAQLATYFELENGGHMIDQAWQPNLTRGMVRAYLVGDRVAGFGHQAVNALFPAEPGQPAPQTTPRLYHNAHWPPGQGLKERIEREWVSALCQCVGLAPEQLPLLWDCDFMFGEPGEDNEERFVLCEINVSSVHPFPPSAIEPLVAAVRSRLIHM